MAAARKSDRPWFQFSLSSLFWLTTLVAIVFAAGRTFGWEALAMGPGAFLLSVCVTVLLMVLLAGPLLVVGVSDILGANERKVAAICGIGAFLLAGMFVIAVLMTGGRTEEAVVVPIVILTWWGVQSLILWWMI